MPEIINAFIESKDHMWGHEMSSFQGAKDSQRVSRYKGNTESERIEKGPKLQTDFCGWLVHKNVLERAWSLLSKYLSGPNRVRLIWRLFPLQLFGMINQLLADNYSLTKKWVPHPWKKPSAV